MRLHNGIAIVLAGSAAVLVVVDTVVLVVQGRRTVVTDDAAGTTLQAVGMSVFLGVTFAALAVVVLRERERFTAAGRVGRLMWRPLMAGLLLLALGSLVPHPWQLVTGTESGPAAEVSGVLALLALLLTFLPAFVVGVVSLRSDAFGVGGRVLALIGPVIAVTAVLAVTGSRVASPVYVTMVSLVGIALIGVPTSSRPRATAPAA